ncbi:MAG: PhzF family phenazine biosynthesis protein [Parahaliea sp.]
MTVFTELGDDRQTRIRVRTFAPGEGVPEDPVCSSGNGSVAVCITRYKHADQRSGAILPSRESRLDRADEIFVDWQRSGAQLQIKIGGEVITIASGQLYI